MKRHRSLLVGAALAAALCIFGTAPSHGQTTTTGGSATGGSATSNGGSATGGSATGGNATAIGGSATGGTATSGSATAGTASSTIGNRQITASAARASVQSEGDSARVQLDDHVITVEPDKLLVDGGERAKLPASAKNIRLTLADGRLTVVADGRPVLTEKLSEE